MESGATPSPRLSSSSRQSSDPGLTPTYLYVYLPYLHFDTYRHVIQRRKVLNRRLAHGRAIPVPREVADLDSLELRVLWENLGHDPPLNDRRTLDQFGYPSLKETNARDDDQMLYKLTKEDKFRAPIKRLAEDPHVATLVKSYSSGTKMLHEMVEKEQEHAQLRESENEAEAEAELRDGNLLMVDQLWLWAIDTSELRVRRVCDGISDMSQPRSRPSSRNANPGPPRGLCSSRPICGTRFTTSSMVISQVDVTTPWTSLLLSSSMP